MAKFRLKNSFSAGELSPLMEGRTDFKRYNSGCKKLRNMVVTTQGPVTRRPGTEFVHDLSVGSISLGITGKVRLVPFVFNEYQSYMLLFYQKAADDNVFVVIIYDGKILTDADAIPESTPVLFSDGSDTANIYNPDDKAINVYEDNLDGTETLLVLNTDYTLANPGGSPYFTLSLIMGGFRAVYLKVFLDRVAGDAMIKLMLPLGFDIDAFDYAQSGDVLFMSQAKLAPWEINRTGHVMWLHQKQDIDLSDPNDPLWSDANGWPELVTFHQQRLVYGGHRIRRQTIWFSAAGAFNDFTRDTSSADTPVDSPIVITLDSGTQNAIQWLVSLKSLNIGTVGDEWTITGSNRDAVVPGGIIAHRQTNNGSERIKPQVVGITILFIEQFGRKINEFVYDFDTDSYKTSDISIISKHVTRHSSISGWAYQQTPDSIFWSLREDGVLLGTTYQREHEVVGWHLHSTGVESGDMFKAVGVIPGTRREDEVYVVVKRSNETVDGEALLVERMSPVFDGASVSSARFLDSSVQYFDDPNAPGGTTLINAVHLIGRTVSILVDGKEREQQVVDFNGQVTVPSGFSSAYVGLPYTSEVWPTLKDGATQSGTAIGRTSRLTHLEVDVFETHDFICGRWSHEDGETSELVDADPHYEEPGVLYDGIVHYEFPEGFDRQSNYFIRQESPYPLTVRSITDVYEVTK